MKNSVIYNIMSIIIILSLAACAAAEQSTVPEPTARPWAFPLSEAVMVDSEELLTLVNVQVKLTSEFKPKGGLMNITVRKTKDTQIQMRKVSHDALKAMFAAADGDGVKLYAHSGYRSYNTQKVMYNNRLNDLGYDDKAVQQPGASDHQTGLGIDIISRAWIGRRLNGDFYDTKEGTWLAEHCAEYGFVVRYPKGKEGITGIIYEPWHLRYVGVEAARYMTDSGLTLEEFWDQWDEYREGAWEAESFEAAGVTDYGESTVVVDDIGD